MFFKPLDLNKVFSVFAGIILVSILSGCGLDIGDKPKAPERIKLDFSEYKCLYEIGKNTTQYFDRKLTNRQIELFHICVARSLRNFEYYLKGNDFDPVQLKDYLNRHFLKRHKISEDYLKNIMEFKVFMLGGSPKRLSRKDLKELIKLVNLAKDLAIGFNPYLGLISGSGSEFNLEKYEAVKYLLQGFSREITVRISESKVPMRLELFREIIKNTKDFLNWQKYGASYGEIDDFVNLFKSFKKVSLGGSPDIVNYHEWPTLLNSGFEMLYLYLDYKYFLKDRHIVVGPGLPYLSKLVHGGLAKFEEFVLNQKSGYIAINDLNSLINSLGALKILPWGLSAHSYRETLPAILNQLFRISPLPAPPSPGLMTSHLAMMKVDFSVWEGFQNLINESLYDKLSLQIELRFAEPFIKLGGLIKDAMKQIDMSSLLAFDKYGYDTRSMAKLLTEVPAYFAEGDGRIHLSSSSIANLVGSEKLAEPKSSDKTPRTRKPRNSSRYKAPKKNPPMPTAEWSLPPVQGPVNYNTLTHFNLIRSLSKLLVRGWSDEDKFYDLSGVSREGMISFYKAAKPLGQELKIMDPRTKNSGSRIFNEGNLFTFSANGMFNDTKVPNSIVNYLTYNESIELISSVYSAGNIRREMYQFLIENCDIGPSPLDVFGDKKIPVACFKDHFRKLAREKFDNLKGFSDAMRSYTESEWVQLYESTYNLSKYACESAEWVEVTELGVFSAIYHYLEVIFVRFDTDENGILSQEELEGAFPLFKGFIQNLVETKKPQITDSWFYNPDKISRIVFGFVVNKQRFPSIEEDFEWIAGEAKWANYELTPLKRIDFLKILGDLSSMSSPSCP